MVLEWNLIGDLDSRSSILRPQLLHNVTLLLRKHDFTGTALVLVDFRGKIPGTTLRVIRIIPT